MVASSPASFGSRVCMRRKVAFSELFMRKGVSSEPVRFAITLVLLATLAGRAAATHPLRQVFLHPPDEAKPRGYWVWPHGNFDYATMRHELAEFKAKGLGGVDIFDLGVREPKKVIPPGPGLLSVEQADGIAFALAEAKLTGMTWSSVFIHARGAGHHLKNRYGSSHSSG